MSTTSVQGGRYARAAGMLCRDERFHRYLDQRARAKFGADVPDGTHSEDDARDWLCRACGVGSRRELDHDARAAGMLWKIQNAFRQWTTQGGRHHE
ncbi:hypothetical protein [Larsenimonas rhizosphaerae]|uniref:hypothetical protein n=1 Tax=Larsenimonas rhizosphaerae TaxID=2944682 RepID=UPI0020343DB7|nr:hypothetical protein [Larsenimonas rhizosphaerae]MCM2131431.1 hypothetical protein [Larsenimonas rhizosphaerae]